MPHYIGITVMPYGGKEGSLALSVARGTRDL